MRRIIPIIPVFLSFVLCAGCPEGNGDGDGGNGGTAGSTGSGGTAGTGGTGGTGGTAATGGSPGGAACGAGTACNSQDGDSGNWCIENVCGSPENLDFAFCNDNPSNPDADGEFGCGCTTGECSRTPENDCFAPTACSLDGGDAFCGDVCDTECGAESECREAFCLPQSATDGICETFCRDGRGTCFQ